MTISQMNFVWKYEGERHAKIPPNVFTANWLPQQAILGEPNYIPRIMCGPEKMK